MVFVWFYRYHQAHTLIVCLSFLEQLLNNRQNMASVPHWIKFSSFILFPLPCLMAIFMSIPIFSNSMDSPETIASSPPAPHVHLCLSSCFLWDFLNASQPSGASWVMCHSLMFSPCLAVGFYWHLDRKTGTFLSLSLRLYHPYHKWSFLRLSTLHFFFDSCLGCVNVLYCVPRKRHICKSLQTLIWTFKRMSDKSLCYELYTVSHAVLFEGQR